MVVRRFTIGLLALLLTACGGAAGQPAGKPAAPQAGSATPAAAPAPVHVTLRQAYLVQGYSAPFILAKEKGFYNDAGFDVDIPEGKGSASTAETVADSLKEFPKAGRSIIQDSWKISAGLLHTQNTQGKPTGCMSDKDWQQTIDIMHQYGGLKDVKPLDAYYTNRFITGSSGG